MEKYINDQIIKNIMADLLDDWLNLEILRRICASKHVSINYSYLSKKLRRHRDTVRKRVKELLKRSIINPPVFPFFGQFRDHHLMVIVQADIPLGRQVKDWIKNDAHIFAAYKLKRGEYNLLLILFHRSILRYQLWRRSLVRDQKIPPRSNRYPSSASFFSTQMMIKYEPSACVKLLEETKNKKGKLILQNYAFDDISFEILKSLTNGEGIKVNEHQLSKELNVNRKTIKQRIKKLIDANLLLPPVCRFPKFFGPSDSVLVISLVEVKKREKEFINLIKQDPHISFAFQICHGKYNYLLFEVFERVADHIQWEHSINKKFKDCLGVCDAIYLTPNMTINMDQQKVSLKMIEKKLELMANPKKLEKWNPFLKEI